MSSYMDNDSRMIYMDNAATTRLKDSVLEAMMPYLTDCFHNPGGIYDPGLHTRKAVASSRSSIAATLNAHPSEIYFTCGGTEADNWAIKSIPELKADSPRPVQIIVSSFEHHAVLGSAKWLEGRGVKVCCVRPRESGIIDVSDIEKNICADTALISVMHVNNELGTIQDISEIGRLAHDHGILFHTDAVASYGHLPIDVKKMNIDLLSASAHKFGGPKGAGFLYADEKLKLPSFMHGGGQEQGRRAGTENTAAIVGMAAAAEHAHEYMDAALIIRRELDEYMLRGIGRLNKEKSGKGDIRINGTADTLRCGARMPGSFNIMIPGTGSEEVIVRLGMEGICVSAGAACASSYDSSSI